MDLIFEIVFLLIFRYVGAFVIWVFTAFTRPYKKILEMDAYFLGMLGIVAAVLAAWGISKCW